MSSVPEYPRAALHRIADAIGPEGQHLYLGGDEAARDLSLLRAHGITAVVNCAINLDINYVCDPYLPLEGEKLAEKMNALRLAGVYFRPVHFTPQWGKYQGRVCNGIQIHVTDRQAVSSVTVGMLLLETIREQGGSRFKWNEPKGNERWMIDLYAGGTELRTGRISAPELLKLWARQAEEFRLKSAKYQLYK